MYKDETLTRSPVENLNIWKEEMLERWTHWTAENLKRGYGEMLKVETWTSEKFKHSKVETLTRWKVEQLNSWDRRWTVEQLNI